MSDNIFHKYGKECERIALYFEGCSRNEDTIVPVRDWMKKQGVYLRDVAEILKGVGDAVPPLESAAAAASFQKLSASLDAAIEEDYAAHPRKRPGKKL